MTGKQLRQYVVLRLRGGMSLAEQSAGKGCYCFVLFLFWFWFFRILIDETLF